MLLGRAAGLTEDKLAHLGDDPLPEGVYEADEAAIVRYAQRSTRLESIDDDMYAELAEHFDTKQLIEICFTVGFSNMINRFHATFRTDLDPVIRAAVGDACPLAFPDVPGT
ncbi:MAG TPA: hypothetical protein VFV00_10135 [Acidimicrobiales bacterium]|nr:hypothetical protein [Acidimicrobiales bacterium]